MLWVQLCNPCAWSRPTTPDDVVAATKEYRSFMKAGKLQVRYGPIATHYHLRQDCIKEKNVNFNPVTDLVLSPKDYARFLPAHEMLLQKEFGISCNK